MNNSTTRTSNDDELLTTGAIQKPAKNNFNLDGTARPFTLNFVASADMPLTKNLTTGEGYPNVANVSSFISTITDLNSLYEVMKLQGEYGHALLTGELKKQLVNESRAGKVDPNCKTNLLTIDIDSDTLHFKNRDSLLTALGLGNSSYIFQHSSRSLSTDSLRGHYFLLLNEPTDPALIKRWLKSSNLIILNDYLELNKSGTALKWPLDIIVNDPGRLIYIAPPICDLDPIAERITLHQRETTTIKIPEVTEDPNEMMYEKIAALRSNKGLLPIAISTENGQKITRVNQEGMDKVEISDFKDNKSFTYVNLNGGDSWGYYINHDNPEIIRNFKDEPYLLLNDVDPDLFEKLRIKSPNGGVNLPQLNTANGSEETEAKIFQYGNVVINTDSSLSKAGDSTISSSLASSLIDNLMFSRIKRNWFEYRSGIWTELSPTAADDVLVEFLTQLLGSGFSKSKFMSVKYFLETKLGLLDWECSNKFLPCKNGVLDLTTMILNDYTVEQRFNWQLPYSFDNKAEAVLFNEWLEITSGGDIDTKKRLQAFLKAVMSGESMQRVFELIGPGGTGKSTFMRIVIAMIGENNTCTTTMKELEGNKFELGAIFGKRLTLINDSDEWAGSVKTLKAITGGDQLRMELKNVQQNGQGFQYKGLVAIVGEHPIQSSDYASGMARRRFPVNFQRKVCSEDIAKYSEQGGIENILHTELPGILNWALSMGDKEFTSIIKNIEIGNTDADRKHLCNTNKIAQWVDENLILAPKNEMHIGKAIKCLSIEILPTSESNMKLYPNYSIWCQEQGTRPISLRKFTETLVDTLTSLKIPITKLNRSSAGNRVQGLDIRKPDSKELTPITGMLIETDILHKEDKWHTAGVLQVQSECRKNARQEAITRGKLMEEITNKATTDKKVMTC